MTQKLQRHLTWDNFWSSIFVREEERVHRVADSPMIQIFGDGVRNRIGLWLEVPDDTPLPDQILKLAFVSAELIRMPVKRKLLTLLELVVTSPLLYRHFYHFAVATSERVLEGKPAIEAVLLELAAFAELLEEKPLLGIERQLGLLGELIVLERLVTKKGLDGLDAWIGPLREPHDFRVGLAEYEVKTTVCPHRVHTIHGTEQLVATKGCTLFLFSVLLGPAGAADGVSLAGKVQTLSALFERVPARARQFSEALAAYGFRDNDRSHYSRLFSFRRPLAIVPVDANFPAITRRLINLAFGPALASRIDGLQYDVNVDGFETEEGKRAFPSDFREVLSVQHRAKTNRNRSPRS